MKVIATEIKKLVEKYNMSKDDLLIFYKLISSQKKSSMFSKQYGIDEKEIKVLKKKYKIGFIDYGGFVRYLEKSSIDIIKDLDKYVTVESKNQKKEEEKKRKKIEKLDSEIKKREAKIKNRTKAQKNQEKAGGRIIMLGIGLIVIIVLIFRSCGGSADNEGNSNTFKYSECECVEFFRDAAGMSLDPEYRLKKHHFSEATRCVKDYVYNEKDGRLNINPCFSKAWKDKRDHSHMSSGATALQDFLQKAYQCDCK